MALLIGVMVFALSPGADGPTAREIVVRVPIDPSGRVDAVALAAGLAKAGGIDAGPIAAGAAIPVRGVPGLVARTALTAIIGPGVGVEIGKDELVLTFRPDRLSGPDARKAKVRLRAAGRNAKIVPDRPDRYGMEPRPSYRPDDPGRVTICLVHGLNSTAESFVNLAPALEAEGFGVVTFNYDYDRGVEDASKAFRRDWAAFRRGRGEHQPWAVLTHSMGALVARSYVEGDGYAGDVSHLLMIGPTNQGAAVAKAQRLLQITGTGDGPRGPAGLPRGQIVADLVPGSPFLRNLNMRPRRPGVGYHILAGDGGFLTRDTREAIERRLAAASGSRGLIGGLSRWAGDDLLSTLDELSAGTGDGCVSVASTRLEGVADHETLPCNHVELIRGPLLYPDPGPVACLPWVLGRLKPGR